MKEQISRIHDEIQTLEREKNTIKKSIFVKENELKKIRLDIKSATDQIPRLEEQINRQQKIADNVKVDPEKVRELEEKIAEKKALHQTSTKNAEKISTKVDDISNKIREITESKVKHVQKEIKKLAADIDRLNNHVSKLTVEIKTSERNVKKTEDKIENLKEEITAAQNKIREDSHLRDEGEKEVAAFAEKIAEMEAMIKEAHSVFSETKNEIAAIQKIENEHNLKRVEIEEKAKSAKKNMNDIKGQIPQWEKQLKPLKLNEIPRATEPEDPLKVYTEEELEAYKVKDIQYKCSTLEESLQKKPNLSVIKEYEQKLQNYLERVKILEDITLKRNEMRQLYDDVRKKRYNEFMLGFQIISKKLKEIYQTITMGGDAELELADSMDPFNEGIVFSVRPPKKSWKQISNLSGGEKTLSSLALVFALHYYKPSPLYVMDEIDAALDFKNVSIIAHYIKQRAKNSQFIIISLRSNMFELCDTLVGIYKIKDCSASIAIKNVSMSFVHSQIRQRTANSDSSGTGNPTENQTNQVPSQQQNPLHNISRNNSIEIQRVEEMDVDEIENIEPQPPSQLMAVDDTNE